MALALLRSSDQLKPSTALCWCRVFHSLFDTHHTGKLKILSEGVSDTYGLVLSDLRLTLRIIGLGLHRR